MKKYLITLATASCLMFASLAHAKVTTTVRDRIAQSYPPAIMHGGLETAQEPLEPEKLRGFVVLEKDGVPAEKAYWFVSNQEYEYRPVVVSGDQLETRRGKIYTFLHRGQILVVAGIEYSGNTVYLKLISPETVARSPKEPHPSRVTLMLGFKLPENVAAADADAAIRTIEAWLRPFADRPSAERYAIEIVSPTSPTVTTTPARTEPTKSYRSRSHQSGSQLYQ